MRALCLWVVCLLLVGSAVAWGGSPRGASWAGFPGVTAKSLGMGGLGIGWGGGSAAWMQNPASLAWPLYPDSFKDWQYEKSLDWINDSRLGFDYSGGTFSAYQPQGDWGYGAGWGFVDYIKSHGGGAGIARRYGNNSFSLGANVVGCFPEAGDDEVYFNAGAMFQPAKDVRAGVLLGDLTSRTDDGPFLNAGAMWDQIAPRVSAGFDVLDVTGRTPYGPFFNVGAQYTVGAKNDWAVRVGALDMGQRHDFTVGLGYTAKNWYLDVGYQFDKYGDVASFGLGHRFH